MDVHTQAAHDREYGEDGPRESEAGERIRKLEERVAELEGLLCDALEAHGKRQSDCQCARIWDGDYCWHETARAVVAELPAQTGRAGR